MMSVATICATHPSAPTGHDDFSIILMESEPKFGQHLIGFFDTRNAHNVTPK